MYSWKEMVGSDGPGARFRPLAQKHNKVLFGIPWQFSYVTESAVSIGLFFPWAYYFPRI